MATLSAVLIPVMFEAYLRLGGMLSLKLSSFLAPTEGEVRSWVIILFPQAGTARSKTGEADDTISLDSKTMSMDWGRCSSGFSDNSHKASCC